MSVESKGNEVGKIPGYLSRGLFTSFGHKGFGHLLTYQGLNYVWLGQSGLEVTFRVLAKQMACLDQYPSHNTELDEAVWKEMSRFPYGNILNPLLAASKELESSLASIRTAFSSIEGFYSGDIKSECEGLLEKHLADAESVLATFMTLPGKVPIAKTPSQIRVQALSMAVCEIDKVSSRLKELASCVFSYPGTEEVVERLDEQVKAFDELKLSIIVSLENPCQFMSHQSQKFFESVSSVNNSLKELREDCLVAVTEAGIVLINRVGRVN